MHTDGTKMNTNAWKEKKVPSATKNNEDKTDDDAYELYIIQRATSFNSRTRTTAQHDVVLRFYRVGFCELEEAPIAAAIETLNDSTLFVVLFAPAPFLSLPPSIFAILEHALRTFVRKPEPSFPTTKTVG